jgi:hypothetical protein
MSQPKHTPGPWTVDPHFLDDIMAADGLDVATVVLTGEHCRDMPERRANARLIAAAPELLEACKEAALFMRSAIEDRVMLEGFDPESHHGLKMVRAAIIKAEGRAK